MRWERHKGQQKRKQKHNKRTTKEQQKNRSVMWKKQEVEKADGRIYDSGKG